MIIKLTTFDSWHKAAAEAKFDTYFDKMTEDAVFIGTDATENWGKPAFKNLLNRILIKGRLEFYSIRTSYLFFNQRK
jgi:ketosteroid isomerase-like protein